MYCTGRRFRPCCQERSNPGRAVEAPRFLFFASANRKFQRPLSVLSALSVLSVLVRFLLVAFALSPKVPMMGAKPVGSLVVIKPRSRRRAGPPPYSTTSTRKTRTLLQSECTQIDSNPAPSVCKSGAVTARPPGMCRILLLIGAGATPSSWLSGPPS